MLGYENSKELLNSAFGLKQIPINLIGVLITTISTFITNYVWDDARAVYTLIGIILIDAITGISRAIKSHTFSSAKLPRILVIIIVYTGMLSIGWNLSKVSQFYSWIPAVLYGGFVMTLLVSIFENMHELKLIPDNLYFYIKNKIELLQSFIFGASFNAPTALPNPDKIGIYKADMNGRIIDSDERFCEIVGLTKEEVLADKVSSLINKQDLITIRLLWLKAIKEQTVFKSQHRLTKLDGTLVIVLSQAYPMKDAFNKIIGYFGTIEIVKITEIT